MFLVLGYNRFLKIIAKNVLIFLKLLGYRYKYTQKAYFDSNAKNIYSKMKKIIY